MPLIGDENANALMSEFSSYDGEELVTKEFLRAELAELRSELAALENRMTFRLGGALAGQTTLLVAVMVLLR